MARQHPQHAKYERLYDQAYELLGNYAINDYARTTYAIEARTEAVEAGLEEITEAAIDTKMNALGRTRKTS